MYHATNDPRNVSNILNYGFNISQGSHLLLGDGLYVSRDIEKTQIYGPVCFKLLVYPGKTLGVEEMEDPMRQAWQAEYSSAWVPPDCGLGGRMEMTCVKSSAQVRILGVAYGHELLDTATRGRVRNLFGSEDHLDDQENNILDSMIEDLGIIYSTFIHDGHSLFLETVPGRSWRVQAADWSGADQQLWTRTWDNCLENKASGQVLCCDGEAVWMAEVEAGGDRRQKWKLDGKGRMGHKGSGMQLSCERQGRVEVVPYMQSDRQAWRFRCMDVSNR